MMTAEKLDTLTYAVRLYKQGDADEAEALVKKYVMSNPNDTRAWLMLAKMTDDTTVKRRSLERVLAKDPYHKQARDMLNVLLDIMPVTTEFGAESRVDTLSNQKWSLMNTQAKEEEKSRLVTWLIRGLLVFSTGAIVVVALSLMQAQGMF